MLFAAVMLLGIRDRPRDRGCAPKPLLQALRSPRATGCQPVTPSGIYRGSIRAHIDSLVMTWLEISRRRRAVLTLDPGLQRHMSALLRDYRVPFGAVVALVPATGRLLAYVSHSSASTTAGDLVRDVSAPSASVFKLVTAAALLDAGVRPDDRVCYGGGMRRLTMRDLVDNPRRDRSCATLTDGVGYSINAVLAKLADRKLIAAISHATHTSSGSGGSCRSMCPCR